MKPACAFALSIFLTIPVCINAAQGHTPAEKNQVVQAQELLRALYPDLNHKELTVTVETTIPFDQQSPPIRWLTLYVGEGFKYWLKYYSGCLTLAPVPPSSSPSKNPTHFSATPQPFQQPQNAPEEVCRPGPVYPKQFLTAGFTFDHAGRLINFGAEGSVINDNNADRKTVQALQANPQMTDAELFVVMKEAGIKYGPDDKEQFTRDLPLKKLEPFLGKLRIVSVTFSPLGEQRQLLGSWPNWTVEATATQPDGTDIKYILSFDHLKGDLTGLHLAQDENQSPGSNAKIK